AQHADASAEPAVDAAVAPEPTLQRADAEQPPQEQGPHLDQATTPEAPSPAAAGVDVQPLAAAVADPAAPAAQEATAAAEAAPEPPADNAPSD
ncbi:dihydrolipoamide succinyltransferase, partial [Xylella fastidiosa subsp. multiplex]|nr:dihydrolipoamide succinyltransferase [Xylella fastidiosa subsp. multiplex]